MQYKGSNITQKNMAKIFLITCTFFGLVFGYAQEKDTNATEKKHLKILSWNIYMLPNPANPKNKLTKAQIIGDYLANCEYDILVLQEAFDYRARNIITDCLKENYPYRIGPGNARNFSFKTNSGIWILSKIPISLVHEIDFTNCQGIDCFSRKGAVMVEGNFNEQAFQLVGTHLESGGPDKIRVKQFQEIKNLLLEPNKKSMVPQIICGDFNTEMEDEVNYPILKEILNVENFEVCGEVKYSSDGKANDLKSYSKDQCIIDYIFLRPNGHIIRSIKTYISAITKSWKKGHRDLSDHYAISAEIVF